MTTSTSAAFRPVLEETLYRLRFAFLTVLLAGPASIGLLQVIPGGAAFASVAAFGFAALLAGLLVGGIIAAAKDWQAMVNLMKVQEAVASHEVRTSVR